jgi:hypothetical protein
MLINKRKLEVKNLMTLSLYETRSSDTLSHSSTGGGGDPTIFIIIFVDNTVGTYTIYIGKRHIKGTVIRD